MLSLNFFECNEGNVLHQYAKLLIDSSIGTEMKCLLLTWPIGQHWFLFHKWYVSKQPAGLSGAYGI